MAAAPNNRKGEAMNAALENYGRLGMVLSPRVVYGISAPELLAALRADLHDLREIRVAIDGLDGDARELRALLALVDGRIGANEAAIRRAEGGQP